MRDAGRYVVVVQLAVLCVTVAVAEAPVAVSPGHSTHLTQVEGRCPTFNWGGVDGVASYQLAVYRLPEEESGEEAKPVVRAELPGSAQGWTPALEQCLERGGRYAWSVRGVGGEKNSEWSTPALFQVAAPTLDEFQEALAVVRSYLAPQDGTVSGTVGASEAERAANSESEALAAAGRPVTRADVGSQSIVAYGDSCCNGNLPANYAAELGNDRAPDDPDVLALVVSEKNQPAAGVNYIGFFHRKELGGGTELVGEIEGDAAGGLHFTGSANSAKISGYQRVVATGLTCAAGTSSSCSHTVTCPGGTKVLGGGFNVSAGPSTFTVFQNRPSSATSWRVTIIRPNEVSMSWEVDAICAETAS